MKFAYKILLFLFTITISKLQKPNIVNMFFLYLYFFKIRLTFISNSITPGLNIIRPIFLEKILKNLLDLRKISEIKLKKTFNNNKKNIRLSFLFKILQIYFNKI